MSILKSPWRIWGLFRLETQWEKSEEEVVRDKHVGPFLKPFSALAISAG